ncbi:MAG: Mur ligase family protein [Saprospiraceae bacterium]
MQPFVTYSDTLTYLYDHLPMFQRQGQAAYKKDLTNTLALCELLGNPQNSLKIIHVAGTNGKGTVSHLIAGGLQAQGYKVGVYTSPHYKDLRERIKLNGNFIDKKYIINFINVYYHDIEQIKPSFFELMVALAFKWFYDMKVDYVVVETGLGGRLDSTNVITPLLCVITNISFDHQNMLGETLEAIAYEKAGIIKPNIQVVIGEFQSDIHHVFEQRSTELNAPMYVASLKSIWIQKKSFDPRGIVGSFQLHDEKEKLDVTLDITGPFQDKNITTAFYSLKILSQNIPIDFEKIKAFSPKVKKMTAYMGRWEILSLEPFILADSAHNEAGISMVVNALSTMTFENLHIVAGFVNDKDISRVLTLLPRQAKYYFAKAKIPRGKNAIELQNEASALGLNGKAYTSVKRAYAAAQLSACKHDVILIIGSIFVVAEIL